MYKDEVGSFNMDDDRPPAIPMMAKGVSMPVPVVLVCKDEFSCFNMDGDCMPAAKGVSKLVGIGLVYEDDFGPLNMDEDRPPAIPMPDKGVSKQSGSSWCTKTRSGPPTWMRAGRRPSPCPPRGSPSASWSP